MGQECSFSVFVLVPLPCLHQPGRAGLCFTQKKERENACVEFILTLKSTQAFCKDHFIGIVGITVPM